MDGNPATNLFVPALGRRKILVGAAFVIGGLAARATYSQSTGEEISHTAESIHHEVAFKAGRKRVYEALIDASQFNKVTQQSAAARTNMVPLNKPASISRELGGAFSLFGGYITGRQLELLSGERIVQAWRVGSWDPGIYSIVKFELTGDDSATKLIFDHTGFPKGDAEHLAQGWKTNYWEPLAKFLA
jgi:activator of HSP90 ATPase